MPHHPTSIGLALALAAALVAALALSARLEGPTDSGAPACVMSFCQPEFRCVPTGEPRCLDHVTPEQALLTGERVPINAASLDALTQLPRLGPRRARAVFELRRALGGFCDLSELTAVKGIGPSTVRVLRAAATVRDRPERCP